MPALGFAAYIKISRIDKNGVNQTNTLQSLNKLTIPYSTGNITYTILSIVEKPTYFQYYVQPQGDNVEWADRAELEYDFTGSMKDAPASSAGYGRNPYISLNVEKDNLGFWQDNGLVGENQYHLKTYPQKTLNIFATGSISLDQSDNQAFIELRHNLTTLQSLEFNPNSVSTQSFSFSSSLLSPTPGDNIFLRLRNGNASGTIDSFTFQPNSKFFISSSDATGTEFGIVPEPYFGDNDFLRALDCQPLLNNAITPRIHNLYQDIDYSAGATDPVNFDVLINNTATRAEVQISNYTQESRIIPRYKGSKSTSQKLNTWTKGDTNTYGKSPTISSLKTVIAYCDFIGGWPPERMNSSTAHILYIIDQDGNIQIPNTSENSLANVQGAFQTGERFKISSETVGSGEAIPFRTVIRGGQRIEPILYTQSGSAPGAQFTGINFEDIITVQAGATSNYQNEGLILEGDDYQYTQRLNLGDGSPNSSLITNNQTDPFGGGNEYGFYTVSADTVADGVSLNFALNSLEIYFYSQVNNDVEFRVGVILKINDISHSTLQQDFSVPYSSPSSRERTLSTKNFLIPSSLLVTGQKISFEIQIDGISGQLGLIGGASQGVRIKGGSYSITQTPIPTLTLTPGTNNIWGYYSKADHPNIITSSISGNVAPSLGGFYGNDNIRQTSTPGSGFNPIALPWSIKTGDEFRFEGEERYTYMVKKAYGPNEGSGSRLTPLGAIEVQLDNNLPVSASSSAFNLDHFLIRRYVDDASQVIMEGFKPENSSGPFIITPEYVVPKMNKKVDEYITLLTEKGLL